jgi:hypothetical protein
VSAQQQTHLGVTLPAYAGLRIDRSHLDGQNRVTLPDGTLAFVDDFGGYLAAFAAAEAQDYGGNSYARRAPHQSLVGILRAIPRGLARPDDVSFVEPLAWLEGVS